MGLVALEDIMGGEQGQQLLWSYARSCEYLNQNTLKVVHPALYLFDNHDGYQGKIIDPHNYSLRRINIFIDTGDLMIQKVTSLTHWEIMEDASDSEFLILVYPNTEDPDETNQLFIDRNFLQSYLKNNPVANRMILDVRNH
jgi:hypothetical protein